MDYKALPKNRYTTGQAMVLLCAFLGSESRFYPEAMWFMEEMVGKENASGFLSMAQFHGLIKDSSVGDDHCIEAVSGSTFIRMNVDHLALGIALVNSFRPTIQPPAYNVIRMDFQSMMHHGTGFRTSYYQLRQPLLAATKENSTLTELIWYRPSEHRERVFLLVKAGGHWAFAQRLTDYGELQWIHEPQVSDMLLEHHFRAEWTPNGYKLINLKA